MSFRLYDLNISGKIIIYLFFLFQMSIKVEKVTPPITLAEGPHWDASTETLYYINFKGNTIHSYRPQGNKHSTAVVSDGEFFFFTD